MNKKLWSLAVLLVVVSANADAGVLYSYKPRIQPYFTRPVKAVVEPHNYELNLVWQQTPVIVYFGRPDPGSGCTLYSIGSRDAKMYPYWAIPLYETGVDGKIGVWTPECNGWEGFTYVALGTKNAPGIGIRSWIGPKPWDSSQAFWMGYDQNGDISGGGNNRLKTDTQFHFPIPDPTSAYALKPWGGNSTDMNTLRLAVVSRQSMTTLSVPNTGFSEVTQAWQKINLSIANKTCYFAYSNPQKLCFVYVGLTNIINRNGGPWTTIPYVLYDPATGFSMLEGTLGGAGVSGYINVAGNNLPVYTSWASGTQNWPFPTQLFQFEISFNQFKNFLSAIAVKNNTSSLALFGPTYNSPSDWILTNAFISQEIVNPRFNVNRAYMGAKIEDFELIALPY